MNLIHYTDVYIFQEGIPATLFNARVTVAPDNNIIPLKLYSGPFILH